MSSSTTQDSDLGSAWTLNLSKVKSSEFSATRLSPCNHNDDDDGHDDDDDVGDDFDDDDDDYDGNDDVMMTQTVKIIIMVMMMTLTMTWCW